MTPSPAGGRLEARKRAAILFAGVSRAEVARAVGVSRSAITRWRRVWESGGEGGLLAAALRGRRPRLDARRLEEGIGMAFLRPPRESGYDLDRWSLAAVAALIEKVTGERHHSRHVGRRMRRMGWVVPPVGRAAGMALRRRAFADPDGNPIGLFERRDGPRTPDGA